MRRRLQPALRENIAMKSTFMKSKSSVQTRVLLFNKPFDVLCQFTDQDGRQTLADFIDAPGYYAAGRLDRDSEGLLLLTNDGKLQQRISHPRFKLPKTYLVQVDGAIDSTSLQQLTNGVTLKDGNSSALFANAAEEPDWLWTRNPPVRFRKSIPTSWIEVGLTEGRNRQIRRMTAAVGYPTLLLIRTSIGPFKLAALKPGDCRYEVANTILDQTTD